MTLTLPQLAADFADALKAIDAERPTAKQYKPGIGPFEEPRAVALALKQMQRANAPVYGSASPVPYPNSGQKCDLRIPNEWVVEVKLARPFGDNGKEMEHWSDNLLHPYPGDRSAVGDCLKLAHSGFSERKAVLVYGFEHSPAQIDLRVAVTAFELIATRVAEVNLGPRITETRAGLCHPFHQQLQVFAWEIRARV